MNNTNNFSLKKYLITTIITTISTCFIATLIILITSIGYNLNLTPQSITYNNSIKEKIKYEFIEDVLEQTKDSYNPILEDNTTALKEIYGSDYNPENFVYAMHLYDSVNTFFEYIILTIVYSLAIGIILGNIIYFIFIEKSKGKRLLYECIFSIGIVIFILAFANAIYNLIINYKIKNWYNISTTLFNYNPINLLPVFIVFIILIIIALIINYIYQKNIVKKLNENLK